MVSGEARRRGVAGCSATIKMRTCIASPKMFPWRSALPHLKCSPTDCLEEDWNEQDEHDGARRAGGRAGTTVRGWHPSGEDPDSGRVPGRHGLPPKARNARSALVRHPAPGGRKSGPAHLRRRGPRRAGGSLGGVGPGLRQAPEGADADTGGGDGAARPSKARAGDPRRTAGHEPTMATRTVSTYRMRATAKLARASSASR